MSEEYCTLPEKARGKNCLPYKCKACGWNRKNLDARNRQIRQEYPRCQDGTYKLIV